MLVSTLRVRQMGSWVVGVCLRVLAAVTCLAAVVWLAANILPLRHSDLFFSLLMYIDMTRTRLAARLGALQRLDTAA
jgi:hypothetical protein